MIKEKRCQGKGKAIGYNGCNKLTPVEKLRYGLCPKCYPDFIMNTDAGKIIFYKSVLPKAKSNLKKESKAKDKAARENLKTLGQYEAEAKKSFQKFIRLRDEHQNCISCDKPYSDIWDGGHYKKAELYSGVIFDERNCHKQCRYCNHYLSGNEANYRNGLTTRFGEDYVLELEKKALETRQYKYTKQELVEIKKMYDLKINSLI